MHSNNNVEENGNGINDLSSLFENHYEKVYKTAVMFTLDAELAKDATQEAFLEAFQNIGSLKDSGKFGAWVYSIVMNKCKDMLKKRNKIWNKNIALYDNTDYEEYNIIELYDYQIPEWLFEEKELKQELHKCIAELDYDEQQVIHLKYHHDLTSMQIANQISMKEGTVKSKIYRAKAKVHDKLQKYCDVKGKADNG